jgi:hypothetical protein
MAIVITHLTEPPSGHFSTAELSTMSREGLVQEVLPGIWTSTSLRNTSELRAVCAKRAIGSRLLPRVVVGWSSAAWIFGWAPAPTRLEVLIDQSRRTTSTHRANQHLLIHEVYDPLDRSVNIAGLFVSDPVRTVLDVARYCNDEDARRILVKAFMAPGVIEQVQTYIRMGGLYLPQRYRSRMHQRMSQAAQAARISRGAAS